MEHVRIFALWLDPRRQKTRTSIFAPSGTPNSSSVRPQPLRSGAVVAVIANTTAVFAMKQLSYLGASLVEHTAVAAALEATQNYFAVALFNPKLECEP